MESFMEGKSEKVKDQPYNESAKKVLDDSNRQNFWGLLSLQLSEIVQYKAFYTFDVFIPITNKLSRDLSYSFNVKVISIEVRQSPGFLLWTSPRMVLSSSGSSQRRKSCSL